MRRILVNATPQETRIAVTEEGSLAEFLVERTQERGYVGNIYKGRVSRVLPGMQAAFVDIGLEKAAFLHVSDLYASTKEPAAETTPMVEEEALIDPHPHRAGHKIRIEDELSPDNALLVQVAKDPLGMKGARITTQISLPGRYLVFMPNMKHIAVSRKIQDEKERKRLKEILEPVTSEGGFIIRTACEGLTKRELLRDVSFLTKLWHRVEREIEPAEMPSLIHRDLDLVLRTIRDFFTTETEEVVVDQPKEYRRIVELVTQFMPRLRSRVMLYEGSDALLDHYEIEGKIRKALEPKIWLNSGGYITMEQTEALTAVDVNTGRYVGKKNLEETVLKINLEAAREISHQLRLRNVGGIIIIDFIDMEQAGNRKKVYEALKDAIKKDRAKTHILQISRLGLVEMTRQRTRENLSNVLMSACPYCEGRGRIKSLPTLAYEILRSVKKETLGLGNGSRVTVRVHPEIANFLYDEAAETLEAVEREIKRQIVVKASQEYHQERYEIETA